VIVPIFLSLLMAFAVVSHVMASESLQPAGSLSVKGDVLYWEGEELIVKEISGREVRLRVTAETKIEGAAGRLKTGDKIAALVTSEGRALSITLQIPDIDTGVVPPTLP
jgi:hypothetical protein